MEETKSDIPIKKIPKPRKPKLTVVTKQTPIVKENQQNISRLYSGSSKMQVILGIDPAWKKCGVGVISLETGEYVESYQISLKPDKKMTQTESDGYISNNCQNVINQIFEQYDVKYVVVELQLGQFSAVSIQISFIQALPRDVFYVIQHSKLKLKHKLATDPDNLTSNKYNQNKHKGRDLAKLLFPQMCDGTNPTTFDECDALLHAYYCFSNLATIQWVKKQDLV